MIRALIATDETQVRGWLEAHLRDHRRWWTDAYGQVPGSPLQALVEQEWQALLVAAGSASQLVAVLDQGGTAAGIVEAGVRADRSMGFQLGVLQWIYVDPAHRGRGLAGELMAHALSWMDAQGVSGREVFVTARNAAAVALYRRHGFEVSDFRMLAPAPAVPEG